MSDLTPNWIEMNPEEAVAYFTKLEREHAALRAAAVEMAAIGRVWATVWHDKLSSDSIRRFAELEEEILRTAAAGNAAIDPT